MYDEPYDAYDAELAAQVLREIDDAPPYELTVALPTQKGGAPRLA